MSSYPIEVPDTALCTGYDRFDNDIADAKIIAEAYNLPESFMERFQMAHYVPWTKHTAKSEKDSQVYDNFIMWTMDGLLTPEELEDLKNNNPYYIKHWYDSSVVNLTNIWFKIPEGLEEKIKIYTEEEAKNLPKITYSKV